MKITILATGKIKERFYRQAIEEFKKRLSSYCILEIIELKDEKTPDKTSEKEEELIKSREGDRILNNLDDRSFLIAMDIQGDKLSSVQLAEKIDSLAVSGTSHITFIIGGSLGISREILKKANMKLSFSDMTFPHQLFRVMLLEQIYRAFRINHNQPYHK